MADLFRSAFSYISGSVSGGAVGGERGGEMVGEVVELGELKLKVKKVIAEGGYGFVYVAQDMGTGKEYAVKRQIVSSEDVKSVKQEITFLKQLKGHPNIVQFIGAAGTPPTQGSAELIIVTEFVSGGNLVDIVNNQRLSPRQVLRVFHETCLAIAHMHSRKPPIIHRDLKVENLILSKDKRIKLCDFGSATTQQVLLDHTWTATQRGLAEDEIQSNTTPMYRSPEMIDLYSNYPINQKSDIWALGCLLFKLCFQEHPFEDSAKLRILNANYHIPRDDTLYKPFHDLICACLMIEPQKRPSADAIIAQLFSIADKLGENLDGPHREPLELVKSDQPPIRTHSQTTDQSQNESGSMGAAFQSTSQQAHKLFGMMRGGAENLFKNIKDTSNRVMTTVQGGSRSKPLDISYITSRILVMSFPYEEYSQPHQNTLDEVGAYLEEAHPSQYLVFNLSGEQYDVSKLNGQVVDYEWPFKVVPPLESLVELCRQMDSWLRAEPQNVLVIHCKDGVHPSVTLTTLYLLFLRALPSPQTAIRLFLARRLPEGQGIQINASEKRYMKYMTDLVGTKPFKPHSHSLCILMLRLSSVPLYNEARNGCKPFLEMFIDGERVFTSCTKDNMDSIRNFTVNDGIVEIPIGVSVCGNLQVVVHHIKSVPGTKTAGMGMSAVKMFHMQFHTGFVPLDTSTLTFNRNELDGPAAKRAERFPDPFKVSFDIQVESMQQTESSIAWQQLPHPQAHPTTCFSTMQEQEEILELFSGSKNQVPSVQPNKQQTVPTKKEEGYGQLTDSDNVATADLLGGSSSQTTPYVTYRDQDGDGNSSSSSSDSSSGSSSSSPDSEHGTRGDQFDPFSKNKPVQDNSQAPPTHSKSQGEGGAGLLEDFFSNPSVGTEEANLLEFSIEEITEEEKRKPPDQKQYDPFSMWETQNTTVPPTSSSTTTVTSSSFDPFAMWEGPAMTAPASTTITITIPTPSAPPTTAAETLTFDPFAPTSSSGTGRANKDDVLQFTSASGTNVQHKPPSTTSQTGFPMGTAAGGNRSHPSFSGYSGWASFTSTNSSSVKNSRSRDPFGEIWSEASGRSSPQTEHKPTQNQKSSDPFTGLGSFESGGQQYSQQAPPRNLSSNHASPMTNRPMYQVGNRGPGVGASPRPQEKMSSSTRPASSNGGRSRSRSRSASPTPRYGPVPNVRKAQFGDLLDPNLFTNKKKEEEEAEPVPLNKLKTRNNIGKITDPERARVAEWAEGKEHNIRALLSSLHTILWEGETRWRKVGMHQLVEADTVGKYFRKACLSVHPDKAQDSPHENLARAIFDELNDAYELFESSGSKSLYQV